MRPVTPPPPWKTIVLPGLLFGVLLALIQVAFLYWGPTLGIPSFFDSFTPLWYTLLFYLVLPALCGFLVKCRTGKPATGYRVGRLAGISCAVLLLGVTVVTVAYTIANPPALRGLGSGAFLEMALVAELAISFFVNALGAILATFGAFLGSRSWKRGASLKG